MTNANISHFWLIFRCKLTYWYIGGGGYGDWDGDFGVRLPFGGEIYFAKNWDVYAHIIPRLRVNNNAKFGLDFGTGVRYQF